MVVRGPSGPVGVHGSGSSNMTGADLARSVGSLYLIVALLVALGFGGMSAVTAALYALTHLVSEEALGALSIGALFFNLCLGFAGGLAIASYRMTRPKEEGVFEELAETLSEPTALKAADLSLACLLLHVCVSLLIALGLTLVGLRTPFEHVLTPTAWWAAGSPLLLAAGGAGDGGAGGPESLVALLFAAFIVVIFVLAIASGLFAGICACVVGNATVVFPSVAGGAASGASAGLGRSLGIALVMVTTRVWTAVVTRRREAPQAPLTLDHLRATHHGDDPSSPFARFEAWNTQQGTRLTLTNFEHQLNLYEAALAARGAGALPRWLRNASVDVWSEQKRLERLKEPYLKFPDGVPPLEADRASLLFPGWIGRTIRTTVLTGAIFGAVYVSLALVIGTLMAMAG